jgi:hypothetical protein
LESDLDLVDLFPGYRRDILEVTEGGKRAISSSSAGTNGGRTSRKMPSLVDGHFSSVRPLLLKNKSATRA